jgi:hypothetical protein
MKTHPLKKDSTKTSYPCVFIIFAMPSLVRWDEFAKNFPKLSSYIYETCVSVRCINVFTKFRIAIATKCRASTCCMTWSYSVGQGRGRNLSFQCIVSILWLSIFWYGYDECCILYHVSWGTVYSRLFVHVICGRWLKRRPGRREKLLCI